VSLAFAHIGGVPVEESLLALAPAGGMAVCGVVVIARAKLGRIVRWLQRP
jgi:hypothetical protein